MSAGRRRLGVLLALAVIVALGWLLWGRGHDGSPGEQGSAAAEGGSHEVPGERGVGRRRPSIEARASADRVAEVEPVRGVTMPRARNDDSAHGTLAGRVLSWSRHEGVPNAELAFVHGGTVHSTVTRADGTFTFVALAPGAHVLATITADGYLPYAPELGHSPLVFHARPGRRVDDVTLYLFPAVDYRGKVVGESGDPVADATIVLFGADTGDRTLEHIPTTFRSDAAGEFRFHAPDYALLEASHPDAGRGRARIDDAVMISHELEITVRPGAFAERGEIRGTVVDGEGTPFAGARVRAHAERPELDAVTTAPETLTDDDGSFTLGPIDAGPYVVQATAPEFVPSDVARVAAGDAGVSLVLRRGATLRGRVVDAAGEPVVVATVTVAVPRNLRATPVMNVSVLDGAGAFEAVGLRPGRYVLTATSHGHAESAPVTVEVPASGPTPEVVVALRAGGRVFGRVVDAESGDGLALARVTVESGSGLGVPVLPAQTTSITDATGAFELRGVEPGRHSLSAAAFRHDQRTLSGIEVEAGGEVGPLTIELPPMDEDGPKREIVGIGVALEPRGDGLLVTRVLEGGGAGRAGMREQDLIVAVDGSAVTELGFEDAIQGIRGLEGTVVHLDVRRGDDAPRRFSVTRARIQF